MATITTMTTQEILPLDLARVNTKVSKKGMKLNSFGQHDSMIYQLVNFVTLHGYQSLKGYT